VTDAQFLTTSQAAAQLGVTRSTVSEWCRTGRIPSHAIPGTRRAGSYRISQADIDLILRTRSTTATEAAAAHRQLAERLDPPGGEAA
jgi:excisionase family DNA binding protein